MSSALLSPDTSVFDHGTNDAERCGVIVVTEDGGHEIVELPNRAEDPSRDFTIWNADIKSTLPAEARIVGVIHTHPFRSSPVPSPSDIRSIPKGLAGMVYHPSTTSIAWYDSTGIIAIKRRRKR